MKKASVTVAIEKELVEKLDRLADADGRTRCGMLRVILKEGVRHREEVVSLEVVRHPGEAAKPEKGRAA